MVKKLSCVSCGSLKRFPHTFTSAMYDAITEKVILLLLIKEAFKKCHIKSYLKLFNNFGKVGS